MIKPRRRWQGAKILALAAVLLIASTTALDSSAGGAEAPSLSPQTPVLSARRLPSVMFGAVADQKFVLAIDSYLGKAAGTSCAVIEENGRTIYARNPADALAPASTIKILTATAAIDVLGGDTRLRTTVVSSSTPESGIVNGDVFVVGGGDPLLVTSGYRQSLEDPDQLTTDFATLADAVVSAGVREIRGDLLGDDSKFDRTRWLPAWPTRYQIGGVVGPLSALMVNDGQSGFTEQPERSNPDRRAGDPPALAAATLKTLLEQRGVRVTGASGVGVAPSGSHEVAGIDSATVSEIVGEMITDSDNTTAELLARAVGLESSGRATTAAGIEGIRGALEVLELPLDGLIIADGSGLDPANRVTCQLLIAALRRLPADSPIVTHLAVAGRTGTLRKRLLNTLAAGKVRAKTGTLNNVNALVGFAESKSGSRIAFSMIENGTDPRGTGVTDGFAERMVTFGDGPQLPSLAPLPAR